MGMCMGCCIPILGSAALMLEAVQSDSTNVRRALYCTKFAVQVLEDILDDDADMADMYLARRAQRTATAAAAANATQQRDEPDRSASTSGRPGAEPCSSCRQAGCIA